MMPTPLVFPPDCEAVVRALWDYLDRELPAPEMDAIDAHLAQCEPCRRHVAFERGMIDQIRGLRRQHDNPVELRARVLESIRHASLDRT